MYPLQFAEHLGTTPIVYLSTLVNDGERSAAMLQL